MAVNIIVFSDPHGRIPLLLRLIWQFQRERSVSAGLVLVAGDLGVWPDSARIDSSTRKRSREDCSELDFQCFTPILECGDRSRSDLSVSQHRSRAVAFLKTMLPEITSKIVFVGGNHEDYEYLHACRAALEDYRKARILDKDPRAAAKSILEKHQAILAASDGAATCPPAPTDDTLQKTMMLWEHAIDLSSLVPIELLGLIWWLPPGQLHDEHAVHLAGISGIDAGAAGRDPRRYHPASIITEESILEATLQVIESVPAQEVDILLTHDGLPDSVRPGKGTTMLLDPLIALNPRYHFFGHYHREVEPIHYATWLPSVAPWHPIIGKMASQFQLLRTIGVHVNKLAFVGDHGFLPRHVMGHLAVSETGDMQFAFVDDPWLGEITRARLFQLSH